MIKAKIPWIKKSLYVDRMVLIIISMTTNKFYFDGKKSTLVLYVSIIKYCTIYGNTVERGFEENM